MKKMIVLMLVLTMVTGVFMGCTENAPETTAADSVMDPPADGTPIGARVGISLPTKDAEEWNLTGDRMKKELIALGYNVALDYASNDVATQVTQVENMLNSGCQLLIIAAIDGDAFGVVLDTAKEKEVPVISYAKMLLNSDAVSYYVAHDPYMIGTKQGEYIRDNLKLDITDGPYNIEIFTGDQNDDYARCMFSGAMDVLTSYIDEGKLVVKSGQTDFKEAATSDWASEAAQSRMDAIVSANYSDGTMLHAVLCSGDSCALGVIKALESYYKGTWPIITGSGCELENVNNILSGKQSMSVFCDSTVLALKAVQMANAIIKDEDVPVNDNERFNNGVKTIPSFLCEPKVADKENYREILIDSGFYTERDFTGTEHIVNDPVVDGPEVEKEITFEMWCSITENDPLYPALQSALRELKEKYPNIKVNCESFEVNSYKTKIKAAFASDETPDIFSVPELNILSEFVEMGKVFCLDDSYQEFKSELPEHMLTNVTFNGKKYGYPTVFNVIGLYANMELLKEAGYEEVPKTYEELLKCANDLKAKGIIPFGCAAKETECVAKYVEVFMQMTMGADSMNDVFFGYATWNNEDIAKAIDEFQSLITNGYFDPAGIGLSNDETKQNFFDGKFAFYIYDSSCLAEFSDDDRDPDFHKKVKFTYFPVIDPDKSYQGSLVGGPKETFAVANGSDYNDMAAKYTAELTRLICHYAYSDGCNLPAWTPYGDNSNVPEMMQTAAGLCRNAKYFSPYSKDIMDEGTLNSYYDYVDQIYLCSIDGKGVIDGLSKDVR